jgi:ferredoxin--NADP+ reductase
MSTAPELRVAVVGAGPAGLYAAEALVLQQGPDRVRVDILDRLPTPYGLVRYGVAPDHPTIKSVVSSLAAILREPAVRFLGNLAVGTDVHRADLASCYDAVIYATGAPLDRRLGIPGEDLDGSVSATEFVAWYNGHPDAAADRVLDAESIVVVGAGNVALDLGRVLARPYADLAQTDVPSAVLSRLRANAAQHIHLLARRGPEHAKFSTKELRELGAVAGINVVVSPADLDREIGGTPDRRVTANLRVLREWSARPVPAGASRTVQFRFFSAPVEIMGTGRVQAVRVERTAVDCADGTTAGTGEFEIIPADLVLRAAGYRAAPVAGLPFDGMLGSVVNTAGRVHTPEDAAGSGEYVAGWLKRGPSGVIGTNKADARETVQTMLADLRAGRLRGASGGRPALDDVLAARGVCAVPFAGWEAIDQAERALGTSEGRPRSKIADWHTLRELGCAGARTMAGGEG